MTDKRKGKKVSGKQDDNVGISKKASGEKKSKEKKIIISVLMIVLVLGTEAATSELVDTIMTQKL